MADDGLQQAGVELVAKNEEGFKKSLQGAGDVVQKTTDLWQDAEGRWRTSSGRFASDAEKMAAGVESATQKASGSVNVFQSALTGAFTAISSAAIDMAVQAGKAVAGFVTDSVDIAAKFEQNQSVLQAASGATADEMKMLSDAAIALGNDITLPATSASSASEAMTELVKAGLSVEDTMKAAKGALQLATAAQVDEATAAGIVANALNTFHMEGSEAVKVADMLSAGANASSASITDLADGFKQAGFIFQASNQDADDLVTALSMLTNVGLTGSDAGTALKNAMMKLNAPTEQGAKLMEALGINVFDANGKMKPMRDIIDILNGSLKGMTDEQKNAALNTIFMSDGMKAIIPLLDAGTAGWDKMNGAVNEGGAAAKMAGAQTDGFKGAQAALANTLETLQLIIGTALLPVLTDLFNKYIIPGAQWVSSLVTQFLDASKSGEGMGDVLSGIIPGFDGIMAAVTGVKATFDSALPAITDVINGIRDVIFAIFGDVKKFLDEHGEEIKAALQQAWEVIKLAIQTAIMFYEKVVAPTLQKIAKWIQEHSAEIQAVFTTVWNIVSGVIKTALALISGILKAAMQLMQGDTEGALETLRNTFETIWNKIKDAVEGIVNNLAQALRAKFEEIKAGITGAIKSAYDAVVNQLKAWYELGASIITGIIDGIKAQADALFNQIKAVITNAIRGAISIFPAFLQPYLLNFFGLGGVGASGFKGAGAGGNNNTSYGNTYNLNVTTTASAGVVMDSFAVMQAFG